MPNIIDKLKSIEQSYPKIQVEFFDGSEDYNFLLKTSGKIIAVGWIIDDSETQETYFFGTKCIMVNSLYNESSHLFYEQIDGWDRNDWHGLVFVVNQKNIWHCPIKVHFPVGKISDNLDKFITDLNRF
jgi:hypothetical protein